VFFVCLFVGILTPFQNKILSICPLTQTDIISIIAVSVRNLTEYIGI